MLLSVVCVAGPLHFHSTCHKSSTSRAQVLCSRHHALLQRTMQCTKPKAQKATCGHVLLASSALPMTRQRRCPRLALGQGQSDQIEATMMSFRSRGEIRQLMHLLTVAHTKPSSTPWGTVSLTNEQPGSRASKREEHTWIGGNSLALESCEDLVARKPPPGNWPKSLDRRSHC